MHQSSMPPVLGEDGSDHSGSTLGGVKKLMMVAVAIALSITGATAAFADDQGPVPSADPIPQPGPGQHLDQWVDGMTYVYPCGTPSVEVVRTLTTDWEITQWIQGAEYAVKRGRHVDVTTTDNTWMPAGETCGTTTGNPPPADYPPTFSPLWAEPTPTPTVVPYASEPASAAAQPAPASEPAAPASRPAAPQPPMVSLATPASAPAVPAASTIPAALLTEWQRMVHRMS